MEAYIKVDKAVTTIHVTADVNKHNDTPLTLAALQGQRQVVQMLLRTSATEVSAQNSKGGALIRLAPKPTSPLH